MNITVLRVASHSASRSSASARASARRARRTARPSAAAARSWISARDDRDALAHAARQLARIAVGEFREPHLREQRASRARDTRAGRSPRSSSCSSTLSSDRAPFEQHRALEHDAEVGLRPRRRARPCDAHLAGARRDAGPRRCAAACSCRSPTDRRSRGTRRRRSRGRSGRARASRGRARRNVLPRRRASIVRARRARRPPSGAASRDVAGERARACSVRHFAARTRWCGTSSRACRS